MQIQLDPTFQPHYELYDGIVLQLVCQGSSAPVVIARGGRYDALVQRLGGEGTDATGMGFSYCVDHIRNLPGDTGKAADEESSVADLLQQPAKPGTSVESSSDLAYGWQSLATGSQAMPEPG